MARHPKYTVSSRDNCLHLCSALTVGIDLISQLWESDWPNNRRLNAKTGKRGKNNTEEQQKTATYSRDKRKSRSRSYEQLAHWGVEVRQRCKVSQCGNSVDYAVDALGAPYKG